MNSILSAAKNARLSVIKPSRPHAPYLFFLPGLILLGVVMIYPIAWGFYLSLQRLNMATFSPPVFIGFRNYEQLFANTQFITALVNTFVFVVVSIALEFIIGLGYALLLRERFRGYGLLRGIVLLPWMMPPVVVAFVWAWLLNGSSGVLNHVLLRLGVISTSINWLSTPGLTLPVIILVDVWRTTPFVMLVLLAGLQNIPTELYEAAKIDGAGAWQRLLRITMPLLKPAATVAFLMRVIIALRFFDIVWVMTRGGPAGTTEMLGTLGYKQSIMSMNMGSGSAVTTIIFILSFVVSIGYMRMLLTRRIN